MAADLRLTAPRARRARRVPWLRERLSTSPGRMQVLMASIFVACGLFSVLFTAGFAELRATVRAIGRDTVPSIVAAERIRAKLADMDANAANAFLANGAGDQHAWTLFLAEVPEVATDLVQAARDITLGEEERKPIQAIVADMLTYTRLIGEARTLDRQIGIARLAEASRLMHERVLPAAAAIDEANFRHLNLALAAHETSETTDLVEMATALALLGAFLVHTQVYLARHSHRLVNPPLYIASVALACFAVWSFHSHLVTSERLIAAKEEAVDSMHALWKARAVAYDANGDESRYLVATGDALAQQSSVESFRQKAAMLVGVAMPDALAQARAGIPSFSGFLGDALRQANLPGERPAALAMLERWGEFLAIDDQARALEAAGRHEAAAALAMGNEKGQSNWAFARFDAALDRTRAINRAEFDEVVEASVERLAPMPATVPALALFIAAMAWLGLQPRINEYRV